MRAALLTLAALVVAGGVGVARAQTAQSAQATQAATAADSSPSRQHELRALLARGRHAADIMELQHQPRVAELNARLTKAVQQDTQFFRTYMKTAGADGTLPWHAKMGLTEAEYREYLFLAKQVIPRKIGETVVVVSGDSGRLVIDAGERVPALRQVVIHLDSGFAQTTLGKLTECADARSDEMQSLAGRWTGTRWSMAPGLGADVAVTVGKMEASDRGILLSEMKYVDDAGFVGSLTSMVLYDLKPLPAPPAAKAKKPAAKRRPARRPARPAATRPPGR